MFKSATLRLTGWYLAILVIICAMFSVIIYQVTTNEVQNRLEKFQTNLQETFQDQDSFFAPPTRASVLRANEEDKASTNIIIELIYINSAVLVTGGFLSYFLAKRTLKPIEQAHEAEKRFTSDASHELRTPLTAMKTETEVALKDKEADLDYLRETLKSNLEEVNKLTKLSNMLLNISRLDNQKLKLSQINFGQVIVNTIKDYAQDPSLIKTDLDKNLFIQANEDAITDLIKILLDNAFKYGESDKKIKIDLSKSDKYAKFEITNKGIGITPEKQLHIFDRFYRGDDSRTNEAQKSFGLGLALAKNIVDIHNGKISVKSTVGKETTFIVNIPLTHQSQAKNKN